MSNNLLFYWANEITKINYTTILWIQYSYNAKWMLYLWYSENSKIADSYRLLFKLTDKANLRRNIWASIHEKKKKLCKSSKSKI